MFYRSAASGNARRSQAVAKVLLRASEAGYSGGVRERGQMRVFAVAATAVAVFAVLADSAGAVTKKGRPDPVMRTASGTVIEPTKTIIHHPNGTTTVIVIPRRSYLETGTEVSVGDRGFMDYAFRRSAIRIGSFGPDTGGHGSYPLPGFGSIPGFNPNTPF